MKTRSIKRLTIIALILNTLLIVHPLWIMGKVAFSDASAEINIPSASTSLHVISNMFSLNTVTAFLILLTFQTLFLFSLDFMKKKKTI